MVEVYTWGARQAEEWKAILLRMMNDQFGMSLIDQVDSFPADLQMAKVSSRVRFSVEALKLNNCYI